MKPTFYFFDSVNSTNSRIMEMSEELQQHGLCISTNYQTGGRGQATNIWESEPKKNLLFSLLLQPTKIDPSEQFILSQLVSLAIVETLTPYLPETVIIKWPNDIYVGNKKLGGILIENSICGDIINRSIIGIGLNINQEHFPSDIPNPISMKQIAKIEFNRLQLLEQITQHIIDKYDSWSPKQNTLIRDTYMQNLLWANEFHSFRLLNGHIIEAKIIKVHPMGPILVQLHDGTIQQYNFKEITYIHQN